MIICYTYIDTGICICIYIYTYTHTHTYYIYIYICYAVYIHVGCRFLVHAGFERVFRNTYTHSFNVPATH